MRLACCGLAGAGRATDFHLAEPLHDWGAFVRQVEKPVQCHRNSVTVIPSLRASPASSCPFTSRRRMPDSIGLGGDCSR